MLDYLKENKGLAAIVIIVVLGVAGYFAYRSSDNTALLSSTGMATPTSQISRELLLTIGDLKTITLDNSIFADAAFMSLVDFRVDIPLQPVGRDNPFAPLSGGTRAR